MKDFKKGNISTKQHNFWIKGITALSLSAALQAGSCLSRAGQSSMSTKTFASSIKDLYSNKLKHFLKSKQYSHQGDITALGDAIIKGDVRKVMPLLNDPGIDPNLVGNNLTSLLLALMCKHEKIACKLLQVHWKDVQIDILTKDPVSGATPLHLAIKHGFKSVVELLVDKLPVNELCAEDSDGRTRLHLAARNGDQEIFKVLFDTISSKLGRSQAVQKLFEKSTKLFKESTGGYSIFAVAYLPKSSEAAGLLNNKMQPLPLLDKDKEMFKFILNMVYETLNVDQFFCIVDETDRLEESHIIKKDNAGKLRAIIQSYVFPKHIIQEINKRRCQELESE